LDGANGANDANDAALLAVPGLPVATEAAAEAGAEVSAAAPGPRAAEPSGVAGSGAGIEANIAAAQETEEHILDAFRRRLIALSSMGAEQRRLTWLALALLAVTALLLLTSTLPQPVILAGANEVGAALQVPVTAFFFAALALALGWALVLSGAMRAVWYIRYPVVAVALLVLGTMPLTDLSVTLTVAGGWSFGRVVEGLLRLAQCAAVLAFAAWAVRTTRSNRRALRRRQDAPATAAPEAAAEPPAATWPAHTVAVTAWLLLAYYATEIVIWLINLGPTADYASRAIAGDIGYQANALLLFLDIVVFWAVTDLAEWGVRISASLAAVVRRRPASDWQMVGLAAGAGLAVLLWVGLRDQPGPLLLEVCYLALATGVVLGLLRFARVSAPWPHEVPLGAPPLGAAAAFGLFSLAVLGGVVLSRAAGQPLGAPAEEAFQSMFGLLFVLVALVAGALLVVRGRARGRAETAFTGIFVVMVGLVLLSLALPDFVRRAGAAWFPATLLTLGALRVTAALVALGGVTWYVARRWMASQARKAERADLSAPVVAGLALLAGVEALVLLINVILPWLGRLGALSIAATAGLFLLGVIWDVWTSGGGTNGHSHAFPRSVRLLLYFGYTLFAAIALLYTSAERVAATGQPVVATGETATVGLVALGVPFVALVYALRLGAWRAAAVSAASFPAAPERAYKPHRAVRALMGAGAVAALVVVAVTVYGIAPRVFMRPANASYRAAAPGSTCDAGGAQWNELGTITLACVPRQTRATVPPKGQGELEFVPPGGAAFPARFTIAVRADLTGAPGGCVGLFTATASQLYILGELCADGHVSLVTTSHAIAPVFGPDQPGTVHTLALSVDSSSVRLAVDGKAVGRLALPSAARYQEVGLSVANLGTTSGAALLSDFSYTPTP
jgi:hypothetical protein